LPRLEALEARLAPALFKVTSLIDSNAAGSGSLRRAITDSNATAGPNQIDILTPGVYHLTLTGADENANATGDLDVVGQGVTITNKSGGSVEIDANGLSDRVLDVAPTGPGVNVTITGVTIERGNPTGPGGGIRSQNSNLVLTNDRLFDNAAGTNGGGLSQTGGGDLTITNCLIDLNRSGVGGGGALIIDTQDVTITNSQFFANAASAGDGGGLLCLNASTSLFISSSSFVTNTASPAPGQPSNGGGLELRTNNATLTDVTVSGNHADIGGGIGGVPNAADGIVLRNATVAFNTADTRGGGILCDANGQGTVRLVNTIVAKNILGTGATHPDVDNNDNTTGLTDGGSNFIGSNDGAATFVAGTPNAQGSFVGTTAAPLDPLLGPLADNGGSFVLPDGSHVLTRANLAVSGNDGVRDRGTDTGAPGTDERGFTRLVDAHVDIGAFEFQDFDVAVSAVGPVGTVHALLPATFTFTVTNHGPNPSHGVTLSTTLPAGTFVVSASTSFTILGDAGGNHVTLTVPDLASGASTAVTMTILPRDPGPLTVTGALSSHDDTNLANNTASASVAVLPHPTPVTGFADVTSLVQVTPLAKRRPRPRRQQFFLLTNGSGTPIQGLVGAVPFLPRRVKLRNASGLTRGGQQFVRLDVGGDGILDPGESTAVLLVFSQPVGPRALRLLAGAFA
jgi:uncharacterized repeat protein (TIGR01451 family)